MSPAETFATGEIVKTLNAGGVTILAVEHDMSFVRKSPGGHRVASCRIFAQGGRGDRCDERVAAIYLGQGMRKEIVLSTLKLRSGYGGSRCCKASTWMCGRRDRRRDRPQRRRQSTLMRS